MSSINFLDLNGLTLFSNKIKQYTTDKIKEATSMIKSDGDGDKFLSDDGIYRQIEIPKLEFSNQLKFHTVEQVIVDINGVENFYDPNQTVTILLDEGDVFEIKPTSNNSIDMLESWPNALGYFYPWLDGVKIFSNIIFDMNDVAMYEKWNQGHQGQYQVQFAQYNNCIFWSDNAYVSDVNTRTNYTLYYSSQLPLCYSTIPENTFKSFYCAYGVTSDPNWANPVYRESFSRATWATQVFSYYGLHSIGVFNMSGSSFNIVLPKDCRGLMFYGTNILNAGVFDASNVTNFGSKKGSWQEAFGYCTTLTNLYIKNLKVDINISWSPINQESLNYILSSAANTKSISIHLSPFTYNRLTQSNKDLAAEKNILLTLISTNYTEDARVSKIKYDGSGDKFLSDDGKYKDLEPDIITDDDIMNIFNG